MVKRSVLVTGKSTDPDFKEEVFGSLYVPFLGNLFPRIFGDRRIKNRERFLIHTEVGTVEVFPFEYERIRIGDSLEVDMDRVF